MNVKTLPATLDSLSAIREFVNEASNASGLDKNSGYKLVLAIDEIVTNTVNYGYAGQGGEIVIKAEQVGQELVITIEDTAPKFDPTAASIPTADDLAAPLDERAIGGLGIYLVLKDVHRFEYRYEGSKNINIFAMKIRS